MALRKHLTDATDLAVAEVVIGHPSALAEGSDAKLSLFVFQVADAGASGNRSPDWPLDTVAHVLCMPTALAGEENGTASAVSAGEQDLRILGQVMQCLHDTPVLQIPADVDGPAWEAEITPHPLTIDDLSKIVPSAPKGGFHPATAYQLALLPLPLDREALAGPPVQVITYGVAPSVEAASGDFPQQMVSGIAADPQGSGPAETPWRPNLYLLDDQDRTTSFLRVITDGRPTEVRLLVLGVVGEPVSITARRWIADELTYGEPDDDIASVGAASLEAFYALPQPQRAAATVAFSLSSPIADQYLLSTSRDDGGTLLEGNVVVAVVASGEGL